MPDSSGTEEVADQHELVGGVSGKTLTSPLRAPTDDRGNRSRELVGRCHQHPFAVLRIGMTPRVARALKPVDQGRDRARGEVQSSRDLPRGMRSSSGDQVQAAQIGAPHAELVGQGPVAVFVSGLQLSQFLSDRLLQPCTVFLHGQDVPSINFDNQTPSSIMCLMLKHTGSHVAPVITLLLVSPLLLEFLSGDVTLSALPALAGFAFLDGAAAVLIRELVVRRASALAGVLAAVAFGVWQEGLLDQSLFDPRAFGPHWLAYGYLSALGTSPTIVVFELVIDAVYGILVPIGLTELAFPRRARRAWLGRRGLVVVGAMLALGSTATAVVTVQRHRWYTGPTTVVVLLVIVAGLLYAAARVAPHSTVGDDRNAVSPRRPAVRPAVVGSLAFVATGGLLVLVDTRTELGLPAWAMPLILLFLISAVAAVLAISRSRRGWSAWHLYAACAGATGTYLWFGVYRRLTDTRLHLTEQIVLALLATAALALLSRRIHSNVRASLAGDLT